MRHPFRIPAHQPVELLPVPTSDEEDEDRFYNRPCYSFNPHLQARFNDRYCSHCRYYLTARCPHIDEFLDDVEDLSPE